MSSGGTGSPLVTSAPDGSESQAHMPDNLPLWKQALAITLQEAAGTPNLVWPSWGRGKRESERERERKEIVAFKL